MALRRENLERMIYPWKRLSEYQHFQLFKMCVNAEAGVEMLGLAPMAFHRGLEFEAENQLTAASSLNAKLKERALIWRGLFNEIENLMRPVRARSQQ